MHYFTFSTTWNWIGPSCDNINDHDKSMIGFVKGKGLESSEKESIEEQSVASIAEMELRSNETFEQVVFLSNELEVLKTLNFKKLDGNVVV